MKPWRNDTLQHGRWKALISAPKFGLGLVPFENLRLHILHVVDVVVVVGVIPAGSKGKETPRVDRIGTLVPAVSTCSVSRMRFVSRSSITGVTSDTAIVNFFDYRTLEFTLREPRPESRKIQSHRREDPPKTPAS